MIQNKLSHIVDRNLLSTKFEAERDLALFLRPDLEKEKKKEQIWSGAFRPKIIILRAVIQRWNFADFDLYIGGETRKLRNLGYILSFSFRINDIFDGKKNYIT